MHKHPPKNARSWTKKASVHQKSSEKTPIQNISNAQIAPFLLFLASFNHCPCRGAGPRTPLCFCNVGQLRILHGPNTFIAKMASELFLMLQCQIAAKAKANVEKNAANTKHTSKDIKNSKKMNYCVTHILRIN